MIGIIKLFPSRYWIFLLISGLMVLTGCEEKHVPYYHPIAAFEIAPPAGETTTVFEFDASGSLDTSLQETDLFYRWDWDLDGNWDTHWSKSSTLEHRYYAPGTYTTMLEVRNEGGLADTTAITLTVAQGYSPPFASFTATPMNGNIRTLITFDASATRDDEDSLNTLKFRWDFQNDGVYDSEYISDPVITHTYPSASTYLAVLQVQDPSGLTTITRRRVVITLFNPELIAAFTWNPTEPTTADEIVFDASASHDPNDPDNPLRYRWDFNSDGEYDTEYLESPQVSNQFLAEGEYEVTLEIQDQYGLVNNVSQVLVIGHANMPPTADFFTVHPYGNLTTEFYFNGSTTTDQEDWDYQMQVRWDFDGDGTWDTEYSADKEVYHTYGVAGTYEVRMEVMDSGGLTDITSMTVEVSSGTNETGYIIDHNRELYYATIKIGDQWWFAENLNVGGGDCYRGRPENCEEYGRLYRWDVVMQGSTQEGTQGLCPDGWHIPSFEEWETLINQFGTENARTELEVGGSSDFRMLYAGQRNESGGYDFQGYAVNFWTSTKGSGSNGVAVSFQDGKDTYWRLTLSQRYGNSVRCIKN